MNLALLALVLGGGFLIASKSASGGIRGPDGAHITRDNPWGLPDVDSSNQGGSFSRAWDSSFEKASGETDVPFALIKAHAIRESALDMNAYHYDDPRNGASYGLLQVEWNHNNRFAKYGFPDDLLGSDGSNLYDATTNAQIGAAIIRDNLNWLARSNGLQGLRDAINAYNTGTTESKHQAPGNYVNDVLRYYAQLIGQEVSV